MSKFLLIDGQSFYKRDDLIKSCVIKLTTVTIFKKSINVKIRLLTDLACK